MSHRRRISKTNHRMIENLKGISFFFMLISSSILCIISIAYFQSQFELSPAMVLYKEIAEDCYPSVTCDEEGKIHVVWQSDRKGNWDILYTCLSDQVHKKGFISLTTDSENEFSPSVAVDDKGHVWVVWVRSDKYGSRISGRILGNQESWNEVIDIISAEDDCEKKSPSLIYIGQNKMLLAWISRKGENQEIKYTIIHDGFNEKPKILALTNNSRKITFGKTETGKIFALWDSMSMGKSNLYISILNDEHDIFSENKPLISVTGELFVGDTPSVVIRDEKPSMLFFRAENWDILFSVESTEENSLAFPVFSQPSLFCETGALEDCPTVMETGEGDVYLFWSSDYTGDKEIFFCHSPHTEDFKEKGIQYKKGPESADEDVKQFVRNLTKDPNKNNANPYGYYCDDIFSSVAVVDEELWIVWDSYHWDLAEPNNAREIKYMKTSDGYHWSQPVVLVDSRKSTKNGRDDRHPAITETEDGCIWLFWHTDRYRTEMDNNFEICYILSRNGGDSWEWRVPDEDPFLLTGDTARDMCPSVSSAGNRVFVVWQSDRRSGNFDIFSCEIDGQTLSSVQCIAYQETSEWNPSIAAFKGWYLASLGNVEDSTTAWEFKEEDCYACCFSPVNSKGDLIYLGNQQNTDIRFPSVCYVSRHKLLSHILSKEIWCVWQYNEVGSRTSNIQVMNRYDQRQITDDFSRNERPQIIEFKEKVWVFWDSNGSGNGRGILYKCIYRRNVPFWLSVYSYILAVSWVLFFLDIRSKGGVRKQTLELGVWIDNVFHRHIGLRDVLIGVTASLLTYIFLQFLGMLHGYLFG